MFVSSKETLQLVFVFSQREIATYVKKFTISNYMCFFPKRRCNLYGKVNHH